MGKSMTKLEAALKYTELGMSVIPVGQDKRPLIAWQEYQDRIASADEVRGWFNKYREPNIGIVTGKISNLFVLDVDSAEALQEIEQYIPDTLETPVASTPRGGRHFYFTHIDGIPNRANILDKVDVRTQGGFIVAPPSVNGNGKAWQWISSIFDVPLSPAPASLILKLNTACSFSLNNINSLNIREYEFVKNDSLKNVNEVKNSKIFSSIGSRDQDLFHVANMLIKGGAEKEEAYKILEILANSCVPPFPQSEVAAKVASAIARAERRERNISKEVREWTLLIDSKFNVKDCYNELKIVKKEEMATVRVVLNALQKEGIIEKTQDGRGFYQPVKKADESVIDIFAADNRAIPVKFPLDVHDLVKIMPKNIIILAGEVNAGKSAYLLNLAAMNMRKFETVYFSSEMGGAELRERLQNFDFPLENWRDVKFIERASDFSSAIRPDGLNIIDFLEIHDEFYRVGSLIKDIFDRLNTGLAVIAIQKNKGRDEGLGGQRSLEKPRLYMAMEPGKLKIVKAKNWVNATMNPNGLCMEFRLAKGCYFRSSGPWRREE